MVLEVTFFIKMQWWVNYLNLKKNSELFKN